MMTLTANLNGRMEGLPPIDPDSGLVNAIIDTPLNSRCKYRYAGDVGLFRLGKILPLGSSFPYDFGFIPSTAAGDGDPLDILVILNEPVAIGCIVSVRLLGVLKADQTERDGKTIPNHRLLGVVETEFNPPEFHSLEDLGQQRLDEIAHFFKSYNEIEGKRFEPTGYAGTEEALRLIELSRLPRQGDACQRTPPAGKPQNKQSASQPRRGNGFRLKPDESAKKGMRRIIRRQSERALKELEQARSGKEDRIHDLRKRFKKLRAALRLLRGDITKRKYRDQNVTFRDAAHSFNEVRDARVLVDSLQQLSKHCGGKLPEAPVAQLNGLLQERAREAQRRLLDSDETFDSVSKALKTASHRVRSLHLDADNWQDLRGGLERVYQQCFDAFGAVAIDQSTENLHEWRKQLKYFWYQLQILESVWSDGMAEFGESVRQLTTLLGDDHDLAVLQKTLNELSAKFKDRRQAATFLPVIDEQREKLQTQAMNIGHRVFLGANGIERVIGAFES
jgi:inorganic pyrophosphatase